MSRWLASVGNLLEKLDDQAEQIVDEHAARQEEEELEAAGVDSGGGSSGGLMDAYGGKLQDILAKRGLATVASDDNEDVDEKEGWQDDVVGVDVDNNEDTNDVGGGHENVEEVPQEQIQQTQPTQVENLAFDDDFGDMEDGWDETQNEEEDNMPIQVVSEETTTKANDGATKENSLAAVELAAEEVVQVVATGNSNIAGAATQIPAAAAIIATPKRVNKEGEVNQNEKFYTPKQQAVEEPHMQPPRQSENAIDPAVSSTITDVAKKDEEQPQGGGDIAVKPAPTPRPPPPKPKPPSEIKASPAQSSGTKIPKPKKAAPKQPPPRPPKLPKATATAPSAPSKASSPVHKKELAEAQKEARTLRRHVVSLNAQLEAAENEMKAQSIELEQAADRMEKDRLKNKKQLEELRAKHKEELAAMKKQQQDSLKEAQDKFKNEVATYKSQMKDVEHRRKQEGGDLNKELSSAMDREHEMIQEMTALREDKSILESQITTLQSQQEALGSRLESLTQTTDNAMERERDAENRLDDVLSQHAKQISQRQAREAELERTVQELGAALVLAKNRVSKSSSFASPSDGEEEDDNNSSTESLSTLRARVGALELDLETANANLSLERERTQTMHQQLREMSKESTEEASALHAKQIHYDRQIADLSLTVSKLQASLREAKKESTASTENLNFDERTKSSSINDESANQVKVLSDEVLRLRDKMANYNSESLAMRNRLKEATDRAVKAEEKLASALASNGSGDGMYDSMERAPAFNANGIGRRRKVGQGPESGSLRSVMRLNPGQGERREQIGKAVDVVDSFTKSTAKTIRQNPMVRLGFIAYFLLIHFWTFVVLFLHAHSFDPSSGGDFGTIPHGPHAIVQQQAPNQPAARQP